MQDKYQVGVIGLGKLGMPFMFACAWAGYSTLGYDVRPEARRLRPQDWEHEAGMVRDHAHMGVSIEAAPETLERIDFAFDVATVADLCDVIFVAVQTPHDPAYGGHLPIEDEAKDFDYRYVESVLAQLAKALRANSRKAAIALISTVLPGTYQARFKEILDGLPFYYVPQFIAMGTVLPDFTSSQEPILVGRPSDEQDVLLKPQALLRDLRLMGGGCRDLALMSVASAEVGKIAYNTWISAKIGLTNNLAVVCDVVPSADAGDVAKFLARCSQRITGPAYMKPGMGDGGGCHPRDNIAMTWFASQQELPVDVAGHVMEWRDAHALDLAKCLRELARGKGLKVVQLGTSFKADHPSEDGSHAKLVAHYLGGALHSTIDPVVAKHQARLFDPVALPSEPVILFHAVDHSCFRQPFKVVPGSVFFTVHHDYPAEWLERLGVQVIVYGRG